MFDPLTIGMLAADALNLGLNGYNVYKNHSNAKAIEALKGAEDIAARALNEAKEASTNAMMATATAANVDQKTMYLYGELEKKKILPEPPKSDAEISTEYMKAMTGFMQAYTASHQPPADKTVKLDDATINAIVAAANAAANNNSKK